MVKIILLAVLLAVFMLDFRPKFKTHGKKELWVYGCMLAAGFVTLALADSGIFLPSPLKPVKLLIESLFGVQA
ncbi:hypothetical protein FACS1894191_2710 [Clostridia bacterium]|nr:hypothetical protein FACS1894191_2710 [Clostridia bacterium]